MNIFEEVKRDSAAAVRNRTDTCRNLADGCSQPDGVERFDRNASFEAVR